MQKMSKINTLSFLIAIALLLPGKIFAVNKILDRSNIPQFNSIVHDPLTKKIILSDPNGNLILQIDYTKGCRITELTHYHLQAFTPDSGLRAERSPL